MSASLAGVSHKLSRAEAHIHNLEQQLSRFSESEPYSVKVIEDVDRSGKPVGRLIAIRNKGVPDPDATPWVLLAGEAAYQLRSALDHLVHQLVILNGNAALLKNSRSHQFPIFKDPHGYGARACGMIYGVSTDVAAIIEEAQPYKHTPHAPTRDPLWILQDLNNTDKHRLIPISALGFGSVDIFDSQGKLGILTTGDVVLEDNKVFFSFFTPSGRYDDVHAKIACEPVFAQAMSVGTGITLSMSGMLWHITSRIAQIIASIRPKFP